MATDKQIEANRLNAQKGTGPKTEEGKARSSQNAFKTGIDSKSEVIPCESQAEYDQLIADFHARFAPATPEEASLVDALIRHEWLSRRYMAIGAGIWTARLDNTQVRTLGAVFLRDSAAFSRPGQLFNAARRGFSATLKQLKVVQAERAASTPADPPIPPEPAQNPPAHRTDSTSLNPKLVSFLKNVPTAPNLSVAEPPETPPGDPDGPENPPIAA